MLNKKFKFVKNNDFKKGYSDKIKRINKYGSLLKALKSKKKKLHFHDIKKKTFKGKCVLCTQKTQRILIKTVL